MMCSVGYETRLWQSPHIDLSFAARIILPRSIATYEEIQSRNNVYGFFIPDGLFTD